MNTREINGKTLGVVRGTMAIFELGGVSQGGGFRGKSMGTDTLFVKNGIGFGTIIFKRR